VASYSYDAVFALALATCIGENNDPLLGLPAVEFEGVSGTVRFKSESGTRDPETAYLEVSTVQMQNDGTPAFLLKGDAADTGYMLSVGDGTQPFQNVVPLNFDEVRVHGGVEIVVLLLASFTIVCSFLFALWSFKLRKTPIVRSAQPEFLYLMCAGCIISSAAPIIWVIPTLAGCQAAWIAYAVGFRSLFCIPYTAASYKSLFE
jgi:hypothetical protein